MSVTSTVMVGVYRRVRRAGVEEATIRRSLLVQSLATNVQIAGRILRIQAAIVKLQQQHLRTGWFQVLRRRKIRLGIVLQRTQLLAIKLQLRSTAALSDVLTLCVVLCVVFFLYEVYVVCRVGLRDAEAKFDLLAIPVVQTLEALEAAEEHRRAHRQSAGEGYAVRGG